MIIMKDYSKPLTKIIPTLKVPAFLRVEQQLEGKVHLEAVYENLFRLKCHETWAIVLGFSQS